MSAAPGRVELPWGGGRALSSCWNLQPCLHEPTEQAQDDWGKRFTVDQLAHLLRGASSAMVTRQPITLKVI